MIKRTSSVVALSLVASGVAQAQQAGRYEMGSADLIPVLNTEFLHIDNVTYADASTPKVSSWLAIVSPELKAVTEVAGNEIELGYRLERGEYFSSEQDNYTDHFLHADGDFVINDRNRFAARANFEDGHDDRGRVYSNGFGRQLSEPDTFKNGSVDGTYTYGALTSSGRIDVSAGYEVMNYDDRPEVLDFRDSEFLRFRDRDYFRYGAAFYYKVAPSTNLVLDASRQEITYDEAANPQNPLDSTENKVLAGVTWESNRYTRSYAKVGYKQKKFDAAERDDFSGVAWEVGMTYQPLSYSKVKLATTADTRETNGLADYIRSRSYNLSWEHAWLDRLTSTAKVAYIADDYIGQAADLREDDTTRFSLAMDYQFRRWMTVGVFYQINERNSNRDTIVFDRDVVGITAKVTL